MFGMTLKVKFYGVKTGRSPGVYKTWAECQKQIIGYSGAMFKSFATEREAKDYVAGASLLSGVYSNAYQPPQKQFDVYVDGSFNGSNYGWAFAVFDKDAEVFHDSGVGENPEAIKIRNVAGELAATMRAIQWAATEGVSIIIHHDYTGIAAWAKGEWKAKGEFTQAYVRFVQPHLHRIAFNKVAGHTGVTGNELVDQLAGAALRGSVTGNITESKDSGERT
jgi:ribonuclease H-related protein